jgi:phage-related minor tail protein
MSVVSDLTDAVSALSTDVTGGLDAMNAALTGALARVEAAIAAGGVPEAEVIAATRAVQTAASDMRDGVGAMASRLDAVLPTEPVPEPF